MIYKYLQICQYQKFYKPSKSFTEDLKTSFFSTIALHSYYTCVIYFGLTALSYFVLRLNNDESALMNSQCHHRPIIKTPPLQ